MSGKGQSQGKQQQQQQQQTKQKAVSAQPPLKKDKRSHSDVSSDSFDLSLIQSQLDTISNDIGELKTTLHTVLKKEEIETLITNTVSNIMVELEKNLKESIASKVNEKTQILQDKITVLEYDNKQLTDKVNKVEREMKTKIHDLTCMESENDRRSREAMQRANYNEQYSRKNNIKIANVEEVEGEDQQKLEEKVQEIFKKHNITLEKSEVVAMHRIPSKRSDVKPVLIKTMNNVAKIRVMKKRKEMKNDGHKVSDDVTSLNTGLIGRLLRHDEISTAWFFNGSVYGETTRNERLKFEIYDSISEVISSFRQNRIHRK